MRKILICFAIFFIPLVLKSQSIALKYFVSNDSVSLRWAPCDYKVWMKGNKYGYKIERLLLSENGIVVDEMSKSILHNGVIKPLPELEWIAIIKNDSVFAPIALQALWGETFELTTSFKTNMMEVYNKSRENDYRYGFAMYAADRSILVAKSLGIFWNDRVTSRNKKYIYRVYINAPLSEAEDTAYVVVDPRVNAELNIPQKPQCNQIGDRLILNWATFGSDYVGYHVEKSKDGNRFDKVTRDLVVPMSSDREPMAFFSDSVKSGTSKYIYRIVGVTPFNRFGPYSDTLIMQLKRYVKAPYDLNFLVDKNDKLLIKWEYDKANDELSHFVIKRSFNPSNGYEVVDKNVKADLRLWKEPTSILSGYYKIVAVSKTGDESESLELFVQKNDDVPPSSPSGIQAKIDSLGVVRICWNRNFESDLLGYKVFRSNRVNDGYNEVTRGIVMTNSYIDTVDLNNLNNIIYYKLVAVDNRYNCSSFSDLLEVSKPDFIKPNAPVLLFVRKKSNTITIKWAKPISSDIKEYRLYKVIDRDTLIVRIPNTETVYLDSSNVGTGRLVNIFIRSVDYSGYLSSTSNSISFQDDDNISFKSKIDLIANAELTSRGFVVNIKWSNVSTTVYLYKRYGDEEFRLIGTFKDISHFTDYDVNQGKSYEYFVKSSVSAYSSNKVKIGSL